MLKHNQVPAVNRAATRPGESESESAGGVAVTPTARGPARARHASLERPWDLADAAQGLARAGEPPGGTAIQPFGLCIRVDLCPEEEGADVRHRCQSYQDMTIKKHDGRRLRARICTIQQDARGTTRTCQSTSVYN